MYVSVPPKYSISQIVGYLKGKSSLITFDKFANLKYKFGNRHFWVSTIGLNDTTIKKYIREQEDADMMVDKVSVRETQDPFRDC